MSLLTTSVQNHGRCDVIMRRLLVHHMAAGMNMQANDEGSVSFTCDVDPEHKTIQGEFLIMKKTIHPEYAPVHVTCTCGNEFETRSTKAGGELRVDVCSACHPFYTGKQKILDTGGRVARFEARYGKRTK
ncbi:50S ribosomal protein L31 [Arcanobacterium haemolyticum]|nr:50S ribosomal protein L31 [Arcanobacterium haemolyticum]